VASGSTEERWGEEAEVEEVKDVGGGKGARRGPENAPLQSRGVEKADPSPGSG
jgi:hypothetical protein